MERRAKLVFLYSCSTAFGFAQYLKGSSEQSRKPDSQDRHGTTQAWPQ